jgi:hypothetical protein
VLAAVVKTNSVNAPETAQKDTCTNNLRQIDDAKQQWAVENKKNETDRPTPDDLKPYLREGQLPVCPAGGTYTINRVAAPSQCSHPGHSLSS